MPATGIGTEELYPKPSQPASIVIGDLVCQHQFNFGPPFHCELFVIYFYQQPCKRRQAEHAKKPSYLRIIGHGPELDPR